MLCSELLCSFHFFYQKTIDFTWFIFCLFCSNRSYIHIVLKDLTFQDVYKYAFLGQGWRKYHLGLVGCIFTFFKHQLTTSKAPTDFLYYQLPDIRVTHTVEITYHPGALLQTPRAVECQRKKNLQKIPGRA